MAGPSGSLGLLRSANSNTRPLPGLGTSPLKQGLLVIAKLKTCEPHACPFQLIQHGLNAAVNPCGTHSESGTPDHVVLPLAFEPILVPTSAKVPTPCL
jgi:hypothetical protein